MSTRLVLCETSARGVATVTLDRPARNNAYDAELIEQLAGALHALAPDAAVRVIVIRANGAHFQAGADLDWLRATAREDTATNLAVSRATAGAMRALYEIEKPTLALVQGFCVGGGTGLVAACDIVIAEQTATFAISEARWGMLASIIFPQLGAALGLRQLRRYALSCERFDAARAQALGLVHEVCAPGALDRTAAPIIEALLRVAPDAVAQSKRALLRAAAVDPIEWERLIEEHAAKRRSAEAAEGLTSFVEKREGGWYPAP
jgi:methylglutaconyl-CoA hydratase